MRRRWRRRLLWAAVLLGVLLLAIPATVAQATAAVTAHLQRRTIMRKLIPLAALLALALAALGGTFASASGSQSLSFVAVENPKSEVYVDVGKKGDSPGDGVYFSERLLANGKPAGRTEITCAFYSDRAGRCFGTIKLAGGTIEAGGTDLAGKSFAVAVLGGTGTYANAAGVVRITELGPKRSRYEVQLTE
jgi:hypothetical protein